MLAFEEQIMHKGILLSVQEFKAILEASCLKDSRHKKLTQKMTRFVFVLDRTNRGKKILRTFLELAQFKFGTRYLSKLMLMARLSVKLEDIWKNLDSKAKLKFRLFTHLLFICCCSHISLVKRCHHLSGCQT